jgi:hypothetical protein
MMRSGVWSEWLGVLLSYSEHGEELDDCELLTIQSVRMMKIVMSLNVDEFW